MTRRTSGDKGGNESGKQGGEDERKAASPYDVSCHVQRDGTTVMVRDGQPSPEKKKRPPPRPVPRPADPEAAYRARIDPVRVHLDGALDALDQLAFDAEPQPVRP